MLSVVRQAVNPDQYKLLDADEDELMWRVECTLLLWLQNLLIIPFDLAIVDSLASLLASVQRGDKRGPADPPSADPTPEPGSQGGDGQPVLVHVVLATCRRMLARPGAVRDRAAETLSKLLKRSDMAGALAGFVAWSE